MAKVLLVEDDMVLAMTLKDAVATMGHTLDLARTVYDAEGVLIHADYDLIILDWVLPDGSGYDLCSKWRRAKVETPILFLTSKNEIESKVSALEAGAEDYLTKPFDARELAARIRALLRRTGTTEQTLLKINDLVIDVAGHEVTNAGRSIKLQPLEFALLELFARNPNKLYSTENLRAYLWSHSQTLTPGGVHNSIRRLRLALKAHGIVNLIGTTGRKGYSLKT